MSRSSRAVTLLFTALPALVYAAAVLFSDSRAIVLWERGTPSPASLAPLIVGLLAWSTFALWIAARAERIVGRRAVAVVALAVVAGLLLQTAATAVIEPHPLRALLLRQFSDFTGGYWTVGARVQDVGAWLGRFAQEMESYTVHAERHPPGLPLIFFLTRLPFEAFPSLAASIAGWARPLACFDDGGVALGDAAIAGGVLGSFLETLIAWAVIPALYLFVRRTASQRTALLAALAYPLVAGVSIWVSQWDRGFGLLAVSGLLLTDRLVRPQDIHRARAAIEAVALGLLMSVGLLLSFGNTPIIMICGLYALAHTLMNPAPMRAVVRLLPYAALAAFGIAAPWLLIIVGFGFDLPATYATAMRFHLELERPFWPFVLWHAWDIFTFVGLPLIGAALLAWRRWPALAIAAFGTLATLCLLHVARGETGRVWMFFAPLFVALAAVHFTQPSHATPPRALLAALFALQCLSTVVQIGWLRVIGYGVDPLTVAEAAPPADLLPTEIRFERNGELRLLGVSMPERLSPGDYASVDLLWKLDSTTPVTTSYKVFVHVADSPEGLRRVVNQDGRPMNNALPFPCWRPHQIVLDRHAVRVDENAAPGDYSVIVGLYDERSGARAFVHTAQVAVANGVTVPKALKIVEAGARP